jgi:hypothetical protein
MQGFDFHGKNLTTACRAEASSEGGMTRMHTDFLCEERIEQRRRRGIFVDLSDGVSKLRQERHIP